MHSGYEIPGIQQHQQAAENNTYAPVLLSMNQTHILDQIHTLPASQQRLFLEPPHFLPPQSHHFVGGASSPPFFPAAVNFKLGLNSNEICARNNNNNNDDDYSTNKDGTNIDDEARGSERYEVPDVRQSPLGMVHCWHNQQDSATIKQPPPLWEHISEASNENSECLDSKNGLHFGELEAIYNHQPQPAATTRMAEEASAAAPPPKPNGMKRKNKKPRNEENRYSRVLISPTAEFFGDLVKQVMDHQEKMHRKFAEVIERLEDERKAREEDWRRREMERFEQESEARAKEKASAKDREAMIVSYLERITGQRIAIADFDPMDIVTTN